MAEMPAVLERVAAAVGQQVVGWERPECGLSAAERWVTRLADGSSIFVKAATDPDTADWLANERSALGVAGEQFGPKVIDWLDDARYPILITEDLSSCYWPAGTGSVHWRDGDLAAVLDTLGRLQLRPGNDLRTLSDPPSSWEQLLTSGALAGAGWCTPGWTAAYGSELITADRAPLQTDRLALVHDDVRSDNLCIDFDGQVRFVDWSQAGAGHPLHDLVTFLPAAHLEGGPVPSAVLTEPVGLITRLAGASITRALNDHSGPDWLQVVLRQLATIWLRWVCEVLKLPLPDGDSFGEGRSTQSFGN